MLSVLQSALGRTIYELRPSSNPMLYAVYAAYGIAVGAGAITPDQLTIGETTIGGLLVAVIAGLVPATAVGLLGRANAYTRKNVEGDGPVPDGRTVNPPREEL